MPKLIPTGIIQGDEEDWKEAAATMGNIYQNAYMIITATHAIDSTQGLYALPNPRLEAKPLARHPLFVREIPPSLLNKWMSRFDYTPIPLLRPGWVLQERFLSPRMVHFLWHKMVWECKKGEMDEDHLSSKRDFNLGS